VDLDLSQAQEALDPVIQRQAGASHHQMPPDQGRVENPDFQPGYVYCEDAVSAMKTLESSSVGLVIADPPYFKITDAYWDHDWESKDDWLKWCMEWTAESERILQPGGQLWVWGGVGKNREHPFIEYLLQVEAETSLTFRNWITMRNFRVFGNAGHFPFARQEGLVFSKGKHSSYNKQYSDFEGQNRLGADKLVSNVWVDCKDVALFNDPNRHPTEKPYLACQRIVCALSEPDDVVVVPFAGSGVECQAAKDAGRHFIGFENDVHWHQMAMNRVGCV
jgi:DNA modification methylase